MLSRQIAVILSSIPETFGMPLGGQIGAFVDLSPSIPRRMIPPSVLAKAATTF